MKPNYKPSPSTALTNVIPAENSARSRSVLNYKGVSKSPLDNPTSEVKLDKIPKVIYLSDHLAEEDEIGKLVKLESKWYGSVIDMFPDIIGGISLCIDFTE
jgi:hypothetical protein